MVARRVTDLPQKLLLFDGDGDNIIKPFGKNDRQEEGTSPWSSAGGEQFLVFGP
jgi:hypothetical protein